MTIHRKILRVKTKGSRKTHDLQPNLDLPHGVGLQAYEYINDDSECIVELHCSDVWWDSSKDAKSKSDLDTIAQLPSVIEVLPNHVSSPAILYRTAIIDSKLSKKQKKITDIDLSKKTLKYKGKPLKFLRKASRVNTASVVEDVYVMDEG